jgi:transcriptional regulator GlxA family with amidase domain
MSKKYNSTAVFSPILLEKQSGETNVSYTIGLIVFDGVLTSEVIGPAEVFATANGVEGFPGAKVLLIGIEPQSTIRTEEGIRLTVDNTIADEVALDVLIVPGASDVTPLLGHERLNAFIRKHEQSGKWIGSVCAGAFILGSAGVLDGKQATTWYGGETQLQTQFPQIQVIYDRPVVVDQRHITANGGLVAYRAALVLLGRMSGAEYAQAVYKGLSMGRIGDWNAIETDILSLMARS